MGILGLLQVMSLLFWLFATRMQIWRTDLNTYLVFSVLFLLTVSSQVELLQPIWLEYHLGIVTSLMIVLFVRVVYNIYIRARNTNP